MNKQEKEIAELNKLADDPKLKARMTDIGFIFTILTMPQWNGNWTMGEIHEQIKQFEGLENVKLEDVIMVAQQLKSWNISKPNPPVLKDIQLH